MSDNGRKRKADSQGEILNAKRIRTEPTVTHSDTMPDAGPSQIIVAPVPEKDTLERVAPISNGTSEENTTEIIHVDVQPEPTNTHASTSKPTHTIRKLAPQRPFPTVPTSVSATGPRSAHAEGKNYICVTRKTQLGAYMRRCKDVFMKDGYRTLHLSAMGAAIPHLMQLATSLPTILPFAPDEVHTEVLTGTVEVHDELIPEDDDEDITFRTRGKSSISIVIKVGDGVDEAPQRGKSKRRGALPQNTVAAAGGNSRGGRKGRPKATGDIRQTVAVSNEMPT